MWSSRGPRENRKREIFFFRVGVAGAATLLSGRVEGILNAKRGERRALTAGQCNRALVGVDGEESPLVPNVRLGNEADFRAQLWHIPTHLLDLYFYFLPATTAQHSVNYYEPTTHDWSAQRISKS